MPKRDMLWWLQEVIEVFGRPGCQPCRLTKMVLDKAGVDYIYRDIEAEPEAADEVRAMGFMSVPVVRTPTEFWTGLHSDKLKAAISARVSLMAETSVA